jgi:hypothetical protein
MTENKARKLPQLSSHQGLVDFFDAHDMGEYENELPEADFNIDIKRDHYLVSVDGRLMTQLLEVAKDQQVSVELLVESWLKEKLLNTDKTAA